MALEENAFHNNHHNGSRWNVTDSPLLLQKVAASSSLRGNEGSLPDKNRMTITTTSTTPIPGAATTTTEKKNAYSFQIAPCDPDQAVAVYRHMLYSVYVAIYALKYKHGSQADFHVFIEMYRESPHTKLPEEEERVLRELGAHVHYIPTQQKQSFYRTQLQKFRILGLEQYNHVWHLDADILPLTNLDYVFDLMDQGLLRKNVAFAEGVEPASGGSFILSPHPGALQEINDIIHKHERTEWDPIVGWGHQITPPDRYVTVTRGMKNTWDFWAASGDQGLLLYWIKYVEKDVSFVLPKGVIEHWGPAEPGEDDNGRQPVKLLEVTEENALKELEALLPKRVCLSFKNLDCNELPRIRGDFHHFSGLQKPWHTGLPSDYITDETQMKSTFHYWFSLLDEINRSYRLRLNLTQTFVEIPEFKAFKFPSGYYPRGYKWKRIEAGRHMRVFTTLIDNDSKSTRTL